MKIRLISFPMGDNMDRVMDRIVFATGKVIGFTAMFPGIFKPMTPGNMLFAVYEVEDGEDSDILKMARAGIIAERIADE